MRLWKVAFSLAVTVALLAPIAAQNLEADLQRAVQKETVSGDLAVAIREYQEIASRSSANPSVAARALAPAGCGTREARRSRGRDCLRADTARLRQSEGRG